MITCLNVFPSKNGISTNLRPGGIILGSPKPYYNKLNITYGEYSHVYICTTNSTKQRTVGVITTRPENEWGVYYFISVATSKQIHVFIWTELPINDQVMQRAKYLDAKENKPEMTKGYPMFWWSPGVPITDKDEKTENEYNKIVSIH